jgi:hypothetical protein
VPGDSQASSAYSEREIDIDTPNFTQPPRLITGTYRSIVSASGNVHNYNCALRSMITVRVETKSRWCSSGNAHNTNGAPQAMCTHPRCTLPNEHKTNCAPQAMCTDPRCTLPNEHGWGWRPRARPAGAHWPMRTIRIVHVWR